jgi:hypothetical protein
MASSAIHPSASMFSSFCPHWLLPVSHLDTALICDNLQQRLLLCQRWLQQWPLTSLCPCLPSATADSRLLTGWPEVEVEVDFATGGQSASSSWCWGPSPDFCFLSDSCGFLDAGHPLSREDGSVIYSYNCFWSLPEQSLSCPSPAELVALFYCLIWDSPNLEGQVPVFISPRNKVAQLYPWALGSLFVTSYDSQGYDGVILTCLHMGWLAGLSKLYYDRQSVGQSVLVSGTRLEPMTNFSPSLFDYF